MLPSSGIAEKNSACLIKFSAQDSLRLPQRTCSSHEEKALRFDLAIICEHNRNNDY